jgi:hypothetical protein
MPALTRRLSDDPHREVWHVYFGDVQIGTIGQRAGVPKSVDQWGWSVGFYPGSKPGEHVAGSAVDYDQARSKFNAAWRIFLANRTEADFQAWRDHQAWTREKYLRFDRGKRMPSNWRPTP